MARLRQPLIAIGDRRLMKWVNPESYLLYRFSDTLGGVSGTVHS
jgi:hypothetical protein